MTGLRLLILKKGILPMIMGLDHGRIVERGNHESLLAKKGMYYQLYTGKLEQE